ncbi:hypothetical protein BCR44DRAFT_1201547 [Catenaria anguillulae PL171]|uniref:ABC-type glycine betaine transport system substrate-binding domain-containing protein n=1 Tax=Catenaria anguillulae PL171 TaxID=765915 RepID=A0A1Y2HH91_9FUNG|nr:hypothetical protein BCR44DRAFT_1201547 [Catenaria anguillulae PL171]
MNNSPPCTNGVYIPPQCQPTGRYHGQCRELWHNYPNLNRGESEQIIHDLGLPLVVVYLGDSFYAHVADCVAARNATRSCLVYYWTPDSFHSMFPMDKVALPSYTSACWSGFDVNLAGSAGTSLKCGWPPEALHKIGNTEALKSNAILREFVANVKLGDGELKQMMGDVDPNNATTVAVAACKWVREHRESFWHAWIPQPPPGYRTP